MAPRVSLLPLSPNSRASTPRRNRVASLKRVPSMVCGCGRSWMPSPPNPTSAKRLLLMSAKLPNAIWKVLWLQSVIKQTVSDSNNIFFITYQKILTKKVTGKISDDSNLGLQVMNNYVHWHCSTDYCVKLNPVNETSSENCSYFKQKWFLLIFFGEMSFLEESYKKMQKNSNFEIYESVLYMKFESMPFNFSSTVSMIWNYQRHQHTFFWTLYQNLCVV